MVFVIENNQYAVATPVRETCAVAHALGRGRGLRPAGGARGRHGPARGHARGPRSCCGGGEPPLAARLHRGGDLPLLPPRGHPGGQRVRLPDRRRGGGVAGPRSHLAVRRAALAHRRAGRGGRRRAARARRAVRGRRGGGVHGAAGRRAGRSPTGCGPTPRTLAVGLRDGRPGDRRPAPWRPSTSPAGRRSATSRRSPGSPGGGSSAIPRVGGARRGGGERRRRRLRGHAQPRRRVPRRG